MSLDETSSQLRPPRSARHLGTPLGVTGTMREPSPVPCPPSGVMPFRLMEVKAASLDEDSALPPSSVFETGLVPAPLGAHGGACSGSFSSRNERNPGPGPAVRVTTGQPSSQGSCRSDWWVRGERRACHLPAAPRETRVRQQQSHGTASAATRREQPGAAQIFCLPPRPALHPASRLMHHSERDESETRCRAPRPPRE